MVGVLGTLACLGGKQVASGYYGFKRFLFLRVCPIPRHHLRRPSGHITPDRRSAIAGWSLLVTMDDGSVKMEV